MYQERWGVATCDPVTCINRQDQSNTAESSYVLKKELLRSADLIDEQSYSAEQLFTEFKDLFSRASEDVTRTKLTHHRNDTRNNLSIKYLRKLPFAKQEEVDKPAKEMQQNDVIEPSNSPWTSLIVLVRKKNGFARFCMGYRRLNDNTKKDSYTLLGINDTLYFLSKHQWFSPFDLKRSYNK